MKSLLWWMIFKWNLASLCHVMRLQIVLKALLWLTFSSRRRELLLHCFHAEEKSRSLLGPHWHPRRGLPLLTAEEGRFQLRTWPRWGVLAATRRKVLPPTRLPLTPSCQLLPWPSQRSGGWSALFQPAECGSLDSPLCGSRLDESSVFFMVSAAAEWLFSKSFLSFRLSLSWSCG